MSQSKKRNEGLLIAAFGIFALGCMFTKSTGVSLGLKYERLTPQMYSDILVWCLLVLLAVRLVALMRTPVQKEAEQKAQAPKTWRLVAFVALCSLVFVLGMRYIGFYITTAVTLFVLHMTFENWEKKKLLKASLFSLGTCVIFYLAFGYLKVFLPNALLF